MAPSHSPRCQYWQLIREMLWSIAKYLLIMSVTVGPLYLVICMARDGSVPDYVAWIPGFASQYGSLLFVLAMGAVLAFFRSVHKSDKSDDQDQPYQTNSLES